MPPFKGGTAWMPRKDARPQNGLSAGQVHHGCLARQGWRAL